MKIIERKSTLAKLLAKENITITHGNMHTAYFDVKNRVLGLPVWKDRGAAVYDMLIGHEVGHALYTPEDAHARYKEACPSAPFDICNIVEDIRIERLIKGAYPGLPRLFNEAYTELVECNFFGTAGKDIASLKFVDRLNLKGKVGDLVEVPLDEKEEAIFSRCIAAETFDDVIDICKDIVDSNDDEDNEDKSEDEESEEPADTQESNSGDDEESEESDESDDGEEAESSTSEEDELDEESAATDASSDGIESEEDNELEEESVESNTTSDSNSNEEDDSSPEEEDDQLISDTLRDFNEAMANEVDSPKSQGVTPLMFPRRNYIKQHVIGYKELAEQRGPTDANVARYTENMCDMYANEFNFDQDYIDLKKKTSKKVGVLVREFERRKSAYQYSRATTARTGTIDPCKLHAYKMTDQIFSSKAISADAKSHGMIFLVDYSGSMTNVLADVIEQTLNLVEFCKKVGIPFEVYSFTSGYYGRFKGDGDVTPTFNEVHLDDVILINQLSSGLSKTDYKEAVKNLWAQHWMYKNFCSTAAKSVASKFEQLGGTPLDSVLTMMHTIVNDFIAKHKVQKTMFVSLTDGDSSGIVSNTERGERTTKTQVRANNKTYAWKSHNSTETLTKIIGDIPTVETIGFFITNKHNARSVIRNRIDYNVDYTEVRAAVKKGFGEYANKQGYDSYFVLFSDLDVTDSDFVYDTDEDIADSRQAQSKLAKKFSKHSTSNKISRVLMTSIAEKVA